MQGTGSFGAAIFEPARDVMFEDPAPPRRRHSDRVAYREKHDGTWAREHLRARGGEPHLDLANVMRIFDRRPDFRGRFLYDREMDMVTDHGTVMMRWQLDALAAEIQERFLPAIRENTVIKGLFIAANQETERLLAGVSDNCV